MKFDKKQFIYEFTRNQASFKEIHQSVLDGMDVHGTNFIVLMCAIIIASIGLNMNSTAVIIGAMLISPLMGSITGIGYGIGSFNIHILKEAIRIFLLAVGVSILTSTIYFILTPISTTGSEILARTSPTIWDVIIAFLGGIVGMIGGTRKKQTNVIPGVAIATALMPPLCTAGFGIASSKIDIFLGAGYLFLINCFFITVGTFLVTRMLRIPVWTQIEEAQKRQMKYYIGFASVLVVIPSFLFTTRLIQESVEMGRMKSFAQQELEHHYILESSINHEKNNVTFVVLGEEITKDKVQILESKLDDYGLGELNLIVKQNKGDLSTIQNYVAELDNYRKDLMLKEAVIEEELSQEQVRLIKQKQIIKELKILYPMIKDIQIGTLFGEDDQVFLLVLINSQSKELREDVMILESFVKERLNSETVKVMINVIDDVV